MPKALVLERAGYAGLAPANGFGQLVAEVADRSNSTDVRRSAGSASSACVSVSSERSKTDVMGRG